jgi:hypothetical protein
MLEPDVSCSSLDPRSVLKNTRYSGYPGYTPHEY